jgi:predicted transcriptional regulator YdeE
MDEQQDKVVNKPKFTVVGLKYRGKPRGDELSRLWQQLNERMAELESLPQTGDAFGVMDNFDEESEEFDYLAGVEVESVQEPPDGMEVWHVDSQNYAVFKTTLNKLMDAYHEAYDEWLPQSNYRRTPGPEFEYYDKAFDPDDPESPMYLYIPVEPLAGGE